MRDQLCKSQGHSTRQPSLRFPLRKLALALAVSAGSTLLAAPQALAQQVTGEVTNGSGTAVFEGAVVRLEELDESVTTDERGRFRFSSVPPGDYTLVIRYVGAAPRRMPVTVTAEGLRLGAVTLGAADSEGVVSLEEVLVYGQSAAMAGAINQQRAADNIKSVLDSDTMGQFPDQNVAESLRRMTGLSVENDQGEGRYVVIRGMDPDLNSTSINGVRASAAENRRALQLDVIPSDVLDGLEVQKSLTPDMDGDAIGGSVNVKTLSAFSRKEAYFKSRVEGSYNELREEWSPKVSVAGSNIFELGGEQRLGVAAALSYHDRKMSSYNNEADDWSETDAGVIYPETFEPRYYKIDRTRIGSVFNLDYDITPTTTLFLRSLYSRFEDNENRLSQAYGDLTPLEGGEITDGSIPMEFVEIESATKDREQTAQNLSVAIGSESQWEVWSLETNFSYNYADEDSPDGADSTWVAEFESGADGIAADQPVLTLNTRDTRKPVVESGNFDLLRNPGRFELDELETGLSKIEDTQWAFQIDAARDYDSGTLKFGAKVRTREKESNEDLMLFGNDADITIADMYQPGLASEYGFPNVLEPLPNLAQVRELGSTQEGLEFDAIETQLASNAEDWLLEEDVYAAYGMYTWETGPLVVVGGVRVEYTDFSSRGNNIELFEEGEVVDGVELEDDLVVVEETSSDKSYTDVLPSINVRYEITDNVLARAAISSSVIRPLFEAVAARASVEDNEAEIGNPDLEPYSAWNFDASLEYYPTDISIISAGLFHKRIDDFIFTEVFTDFEFGGRVFDEAVIADNGETATVTGLELTYQQQFGFLPEPFDGLLVSVNYTHIDSEAELRDREIPLPKQSDNVGGFVLGYEKYGLDLRLALSFRDKYLDEIVEEGLDRYTAAHTQWDFTAKYHVSDNWLVYAELINITDEPEHYYAGSKRRLYQYDEFGRTATIGLQYVY